jgi:hypothetical protein
MMLHMKRMLFIHRSVGRHLLQFGGVRSLLNAKGIQLDDYDNNLRLLTRDDGTQQKDAIRMPDNNTNPDDLAEFFAIWPDVLNKYDMVMIKSCYPNSHIRDVAQLDALKEHYLAIFEAFKVRGKTLILLTTPPLRPLFTNVTEARFAGELADWLVASAGKNIHVFDLHHFLAEPAGKHKGMLRAEYRRWLPWDNHPNKKAHSATAPVLVDMLAAI